MKNKLIYLTNTSINRKLKSKWFIVANVLLAVIIMCLINIDKIITLFGGDFNEKTVVYVVDNTNTTFDILNKNIIDVSKTMNTSDKFNFDLKQENKTKEELKKELKDNELIIEINNSLENTIDVTLVSEAYIDTIEYQILYQAINNTKISLAIVNSNIDPNQLTNIYKNIEISREYIDESKKSEDENMEMIMTTVFPFIILPFFMLSIFLVQLIGSEVNDEKTTRGMEIIISNVSPKIHFFSKIIAGNLFIILQGILLLLYTGIGFLIRKIISGPSSLETQIGNMIQNISGTDFMNKLIYLIPIILLLMLLTFVAYSLVAGILASMTTNAEDFNQLQTPIIVVSLIGYYLSMISGMFKGSILIRIFSYIPFISAILSPSLFVIGQIGIIDILISIIIMFITNYLLIKYGLRIYKVGILNYSSKNLWKKMFKAIKD